MSPVRICFLTHNMMPDNGAGVFARRLTDGLSRILEIEPVIFTHQELFPLHKFVGRLKLISECELVHALDAFPYGILAAIAAFLLKKKFIITAQGTGAVNRLYHPFYSVLLKWSYRRAERVVAISNFTASEILKKVPGLDIRVLTHGVDFDEFSATSGQNQYNKFKPYILSVGALRWRKGYKFSIRAFLEVSRQFPDLKYLIAGKKFSKKYISFIRQLINELGLDGRVFILTDVSRNELVELYRGAELFCLLSQNVRHDVEGFGLVFLEAAAAGLPVVGSKNSGIEDAVLDGQNGFLVGERDLDGFSQAIIKILKERNLREQMSKKSLEFAQSQSWQSKLEEYARLYRTLLPPQAFS